MGSANTIPSLMLNPNPGSRGSGPRGLVVSAGEVRWLVFSAAAGFLSSSGAASRRGEGSRAFLVVSELPSLLLLPRSTGRSSFGFPDLFSDRRARIASVASGATIPRSISSSTGQLTADALPAACSSAKDWRIMVSA